MDTLLDKLKDIAGRKMRREARAGLLAEAIREEGAYRWVGIYDVDVERGVVSNLAWSGPGAPAYPVFPIMKGLTSRAIAERKTVNVGDVANDSAYLTALESTRSEIIVPVLDRSGNDRSGNDRSGNDRSGNDRSGNDRSGDRVVGTIDVESDRLYGIDSVAQAMLEECASALRDFRLDSETSGAE
jgi:putative methionine-R-sulfoxide reductase with GAF domain